MTWSQAELEAHDDRPVGDHFNHLDGTFDDYESLLRMRGEASIPRISYREGHIVIVTPSPEHEELKSTIGRLVEVWCDWRGRDYSALGAWTLKDRGLDRGAEPDECFVFDGARPNRPDLIIEVVWTAAGMDKLEIYRKFGVPEVWVWKKGRITIHALSGDRYEEVGASRVLQGIVVDELLSFVDRPTMSQAKRDYRGHLESQPC